MVWAAANMSNSLPHQDKGKGQPMPELKITVGEPRTISSSDSFHWFPTILYRLKDGSLLLGFSVTPDEIAGDQARGQPHALLKSMDGGANWFLLRTSQGSLDASLPVGQLDDGPHGTLLGNMMFVFMKYSGELYTLEWRSRDGGVTWQGPQEVPIRFPPGLIQPADPQPPGRHIADFFLEGHIIQLPDGDLLCAADGRFTGDTQYRVCLLRAGATEPGWSYVSTIAAPDTDTRDFTEPALLRLPDGSLLCILRTTMSVASPMYQAKSTDGGQTWSHPISLPVNGVRPRLVLMQNGVIACSYGRISHPPSLGDQIIFSMDGGETWTVPTTIYHGPSTGYTSMAEVSPGELLYAYDALGFGWSKRNNIMMVRIKVEL
ncbi:MAG: exo-alpha-sialidase [Chloroflexi bacterium]|nr:exo-alpha-sialidase [Chloroflexota bacterium]